MAMRKLVLIATILLALVSCSDGLYDAGNRNPGKDGNLSLRLNIPASRVEGEYNVVYPGSQLECHVNDLRIFGFPVNGNGSFFTEQLEPGGADFPTDEQYRNYNLEITPGTYRVYVVANMGNSVDGIMTEDRLKDVIIEYKELLPEAGNLPMVYEPREDLTVDTKNTVCVADMQFTCVKIDLNLIFDSSDVETATSFGKNGLIIKAINGHNISEKTWLVWGGSFSPDNRRGSMDKNDITAGDYYSEWLDEPENEKVSGKRIITPLTTGYGSDKWLYHATMYLPERYIDSNDKQSRLTVDAVLTDASGAETDIKTHYEIPLGHVPDNGDENAVRVFPRSTYYEIVGRIRSVGNIDLNLFVKIEPWTPLDMVADFLHTTLTVSGTKVSVSLVDTDYITYETNAPTVTFGWNVEDEIDGESLIVEAYHDRALRKIGFRVNPNISISKFGDGEGLIPNTGTSKVYIKAGNIIKYIDVDYEAKPFFEVNPLEETIQWSASESAKLSRYISFTTNLGGVIVSDENGNDWIIAGNGHIDTCGSSNLSIKCDSTSYSKASIQVTATTDPVTTTEHRFIVRPMLEQYRDSAKTVIIRVRPEYSDYRIYFRAINDRQASFWNNGPTSYLDYSYNQPDYKIAWPLSGVLPEDADHNWMDGWGGYTRDVDNFTVLATGYNNTDTYLYTWYSKNGQTIEPCGIWPGKKLTRQFILYQEDSGYLMKFLYTKIPLDNGIPINFIMHDNSGGSTGNQLGYYGMLSCYLPGGFKNRLPNEKTISPFDNEPTPESHFIYVYSQMGETVGTIQEQNVWRFNGAWPGQQMKADNTNSGWYYYDLNQDEKGINSYGKPSKQVEPGYTLMMFSNNAAFAISTHRCSHHMEPGLSLFDYEDREGWIVYDPTSPSPNYRIYDEKPNIINVKYTIYTQQPIISWSNHFGVADYNQTPKHFLISWGVIESVNAGNGWYKSEIELKAVKGDAEKYLTLKWDIDGPINLLDNSNSIIMFDGKSFESSNYTGYYKDGSWYAGRPSGITL